MRFWLVLGVIAVAAGSGFAWWRRDGEASPLANLRTEPIERTDLVVTVGATGTLEPEELVDVGAQIVGRILEFGEDPRSGTDPKFKGKRIDYGSPVEEGTVLARIDPLLYQAQFDQAKGALDRAEADLLRLKAVEYQAKAEWDRARRLQDMTTKTRPTSTLTNSLGLPIQAISNSDFILAKANYEVAQANVDVGQAAILQQRGVLALAEANLKYTVIKSPVRGTIIDRRVNIGQTVVSSLNAPSLFLIAKDLRRMQVWTSVNEADIGQLRPGQAVEFTVDAFPDDVFQGQVEQVRYNASMTQNVVTYTVVVTVDNSDLRLLPYLTADVKFRVLQRDDVLTIPNAALRYRPRADLLPSHWIGGGDERDGSKRAGDGDANESSPAAAKAKRGTIWIATAAGVSPLEVVLGASDGSSTEVSGDGVAEGLQVVLGEIAAGPGEATNNPFAPRFPGGRSR